MIVFLLQPVQEVTVGPSGAVTGVVLQDGTEINSPIVLSNTTPKVTYMDLLPKVIYLYNNDAELQYTNKNW